MKSLADYNLEALKPLFMGNGVTEMYLDSWLSNYRTDTEAKKQVMVKVKAAYHAKKPIIMIGKFGTGKTHLAMALVKNYIAQDISASYYTLTSLFRAYRSTFNDDTMSESSFFKKLSELKLLVIDEINIRSDSEAENRFLQEVMDSRYTSKLPTVLIGNLTLEEFSKVVGERIVDRLKELKAEVIVFNWKSHRGLDD